MLTVIMELLVFFLCVTPSIVTSITISPNGNSPDVKMIAGMMVEKGFEPMTTPEPKKDETISNYDKSRKLNYNSTKLSINERYRRLIPYMTFYYANDLHAPPKESYSKNIEVEKAQILEAPMDRQPKKIAHSPYRNIPRYQGNRIPQYPSHGHPNKHYEDTPTYQEPIRTSPNYNPLISDPHLENQNYRKVVFKPNKAPSAPFSMPTRKPYINLYPGDEQDIRYYLAEKNPAPKYKLVPYEQTPPVKVFYQHEQYVPKKSIPVPVLVNKEPVYVKQRPIRPQYVYDNVYVQPARKPPTTVSESYYEKFRPQHEIHSAIENGFKPILPNNDASATATPLPLFENQEAMIETATAPVPTLNRPSYYQYLVDQPLYTPSTETPSTMSLGTLINSLQINKSIPKPITRDNVGTSIRTLLQVLSALKGAPHQNDVDSLQLSTPQPYGSRTVLQEDTRPVVESTEAPQEDVEFHQEPYLDPVNPPSQHIDEYPTHSSSGGSSQQFPLRLAAADDGGTPGRPGDDYPILTAIPETKFDCKTQRYKGFFADPETRCQVWHYCDLNGGQASFLCPNGTIFSQAGLTCDWWFNVRCASTAQLYVLNESLYKYILPHSPKFPEDYSGPLVDKYLTLKFKEMEEQFQKNKKSKQSEKSDSDEDESSQEVTTDASEVNESNEVSDEASEVTTVSEASVFIASSGASGNVQRLQDD